MRYLLLFIYNQASWLEFLGEVTRKSVFDTSSVPLLYLSKIVYNTQCTLYNVHYYIDLASGKPERLELLQTPDDKQKHLLGLLIQYTASSATHEAGYCYSEVGPSTLPFPVWVRVDFVIMWKYTRSRSSYNMTILSSLNKNVKKTDKRHKFTFARV